MKFWIVSRHFPPDVTAGARRPYLLAQGLKQAGADVEVIAPSLPGGMSGTTVYHPAVARSTTPHGPQAVSPVHETAKAFIRRNFFLPDPDIRWALRAARAGKRRKDSPDVVLTTSPPESLHVTGLILARHFGAAWIADVRDHWLVEPLLPERTGIFRHFAESNIARLLLSRADLVTAAEPSMAEEMRRYAGSTPVHWLAQPRPEENLSFTEKSNMELATAETITIVHTGSFTLSHYKRTIGPALQFFHTLREIEPRFRLILRGRLTPDEEAAAQAIPGIEVRAPAPLETVWQEQREADILLLVAAPDAAMPPGKLTEYRAARRPIICLGGGAWADSVRGQTADPVEFALDISRGLYTEGEMQSGPTPQEAAGFLIELASPIAKEMR